MTFNGITFLDNLLLFSPIGYQVRDLYTNDDAFITDTGSWSATALRNGIPYSICNGTYLVGGYDVLGIANTGLGVQGYYFERIYNDLPPHNIIYYSINLWLIDSWDASPPDYFQFQFDSTIAEGWNVYHYDFPNFYCGNPKWTDLANMTIFGKVSHFGSSLTLRIISQLDMFAQDESLGFRDINLIFTNSTDTNVNELCGLAQIPLPTNECSCLLGFYFEAANPAGCRTCNESCRACFGPSSQECYVCNTGYSFVETECIKCDENCADCYGPRNDQCTSCKEGKSLFHNQVCVANCAQTSNSGRVCVNPCLGNQVFSFEDQTCVDVCDYPLVIESLIFGVQTCVSRNDADGFIYWDHTLNSLCPFPLQQGLVGNNKLFCFYTCGIYEYLYWDGSCQQACESPLIPSVYKDRQFCQHPCPNPGDYIYWNGTCGNACEAPLKSSNDGQASYCDLPCSKDKPYWNGSSCLDSCSLPFKATKEDGILSCKPLCSSSEYLHWNDSCLDSCPAPYEACPIGPGMQFCSYLCKQYGEYYYPREGQCLPMCDAPYTPEIQINLDGAWYVACMRILSNPPLGDNADDDNDDEPRGPFYFPITAVKIASEKVTGVLIAVDIVVSLLRDSHVMILILTEKILNFVKYIDIRVPPQLVQEFASDDHNHFYLNFGPGMSESLREKFTNTSLPFVFERPGLHSRFLVNFFKQITSFLILLGVIIIIGILQRYLRRTAHSQYVLGKMILKRFEIFMRWNLVVLLVICNIDEIVLYGMIEWKTIRTDSDQDSISLLISLGMAVLSLSAFVAPFYLLDKIYQTRFKVLSNQANEPYFNLLKKIEGFQLLWKDFKDCSWAQRSFLSIYIFRIALIYMIIGLLYKRPLLQMVLIFSTSLGMLTYMIIIKPFMKKLDFIQSMIYEICMLISMGSTLILAALDRAQAKADQLWIFLGDCIVFCNLFICFVAIVFFVIKFCLELHRVWKFYKTVPKPISLKEFAILFLKDDDPIIQELNKNKRTSRRLDLTHFEREIERKNFERYHIKLASPETPTSQTDDVQLSYIPCKGELRIKRSLFGVKVQSSDSEDSPFKTHNTLDEVQSPSSATSSIENIRFLNKIKIFNEIKKSLQDISSSSRADNKEKLEEKERNSESSQIQRKNDIARGKKNERTFIWKGLETIKELDSVEGSEMKGGLQTKRLGNMLQDTLRGDLSYLSVVNKRLSSETMMQKVEDLEIVKEKAEIIKKKLTTKEENALVESLFQ